MNFKLRNLRFIKEFSFLRKMVLRKFSSTHSNSKRVFIVHSGVKAPHRKQIKGETSSIPNCHSSRLQLAYGDMISISYVQTMRFSGTNCFRSIGSHQTHRLPSQPTSTRFNRNDIKNILVLFLLVCVNAFG